MANLKQLRTRIKSIQSTAKITKAMQLVSATKLTKIKPQLGDAFEYLEVLSRLVSDMTSQISIYDMPQSLSKYFTKPAKSVVLLMVFTSEKGLCGSFNAAIIKNVKQDIAKLHKEQKEVRLMVIGHKGYNILKTDYKHLIAEYFPIEKDSDLLFGKIKDKINTIFATGNISECYLYFNKFKNALMQFFSKKQILPLTNINLATKEHRVTYEFEGSNLAEKLINLYIDSQINFALLETMIGEEGARMTAMDNATKNANSLVESLTVQLNRTRQAGITKDLIEIIAGAESM